MLHRLLLLSLTFLPAVCGAVHEKVRLSWSELPKVISGRQIHVTLEDRAWIEGKVLAVESDGLRIRVSFSSNEKRFPAGQSKVPAAAVISIRTSEHTRRWRALLTPAVPATLLVAMAAVTASVSPAPEAQKVIGIGVGVAVGGTVAGYWAGNRLDRKRVIEIEVIH
jgi:hypothetical protein